MPRPRIEPTDEQRRLVKTLSAYGIPQEQIAREVGVRSEKTLRRHFREELDRGLMEANAKVAQTLFRMASSGESAAATFFWLKSRAGWRERAVQAATVVAPPPFVVAKEEIANDGPT